jgi:phosphoglycerate dehydrogenase-like enzyme
MQKSKGIAVYNSPEGNRNAVSEHEFAMILGLLNNLVRSDSEVRNFQWNREKNRGVELKRKNHRNHRNGSYRAHHLPKNCHHGDLT